MSYVLPGTYVALCRKCGGWTRWCTQDAPKDTVDRFHEKVRASGDKKINLKFGDDRKILRCSCKESQ